MGFLFEVAQVEVQNWRPSSGSDWRGIYLDVYVEKAKKRKLKCCCRRKKGAAQRKTRTGIEDESRMMRWRVLNKEGFLQALFVLGDERKRRRKGDQLLITADVMAVSELGQEKGVHVATFKGKMQVGTWGSVLLYDADQKEPEGNEEEVKFSLETRPISARPFKLENARPWDDKGSLALIMRAARFGRRMSQQSHRQVGVPLVHSNSKKDSEKAAASSKKNRKSTWSVGSLLATASRKQLEEEEGSDGSEEKQKPSSSKTEDDGFPFEKSMLQRLGGRGHSFAAAGLPQKYLSKQAEDPESGDEALPVLEHIDVTVESTFSRNSAQMRSLMDKFFESMADDTLAEPGGRRRNPGGHWLLQRKHTASSINAVPLEECNREWKPTDWQLMWHCAKADNATKGDGYDVVPLMEAEFRRDCVVLYNTLFPSVDSRSFQVVKNLALSSDAEQAMRFRKVGLTRESRAGGRRSEVDAQMYGGGIVQHLWSRVSAPGIPRTSRRSSVARVLRDWGGAQSTRTTNRSEAPSKEAPDEDLDLETGEYLTSPAEAGQSATSSTNSNSVRAGSGGAAPSESDATASSMIDDDQLYVLKLDMLHNMDEARGVVLHPRAPETPQGRKPSKSTEELRDPFADIPEEGSLVLNAEKGEYWKKASLPEFEMLRDEGEEEDKADQKSPSSGPDAPGNRRPLPRRNSNVSTVSAAESVTTVRAGVAPLLARMPDGKVMSTVAGDMPHLNSSQEIFIDDYSPHVMFLKRLLICYTFCGVYYSELGNAEQLGDPWPYPIAAVLGHGCRVLIRLEDVDPTDFLNFLLTGEPHSIDWKESGCPMPLKKRIAATHSVEITETGQVVERKTPYGDLLAGIMGRHMGLNLPIGGAGNPSPLSSSCMVGFHGNVLSRKTEEKNRSVLRFFSSRWRRSEDSAQTTKTDIISEMSGDSTPRSQEAEDWKPEKRMQGGHLYIRADDFGEVNCLKSSSMAVSDETDGNTKHKFKTDKDTVHMRMAKVRQQAELRNDLPAGDLIFPRQVPQLSATRRARMAARRGGDGGGGLRLLRVSSEPDLGGSLDEGAAPEDIMWVGQALVARENLPLPTPPSSMALRMLFDHYDPMNAQLYGTGNFKSFEQFQTELASGTSLLVRSPKGGLQRFCQPVILQLRFRGIRVGIIDALTPSAKREQDCLTVLTETTMSPSYPGMASIYRTHMVCWEVQPERGDVLSQNGLTFPMDESGGERPSSSNHPGLPFQCHFCTFRNGTGKKIFWRWVPYAAAQKLQRFVNLGEATADERWAKYAFQKEGVVQFPPTETALLILLRRCGIDVEKFGTGRYRTMKEFWLDLTAKESLLQMSGGKPLRLADSTVVRLKWRQPGDSRFQVLVKEIKNSGGRRKLLTRRMLNGETWEESALACLEEDLGVKSKDCKYLLAQKSNDKSSYTFLQEKTESDKYPGIKCLYRTHLVSYEIRQELGTLISTRIDEVEPTLLQGLLPDTLPGVHALRSTASSPSRRTPFSDESPARIMSPSVAPSATERTTTLGGKAQRLSLKASPNFAWMPENQLHGVKGGDFWEIAAREQEKHRVCSVLVGLEGTAPQKRSPFGVEHDGSGKSASISAVGNCKWSTYRQNNALQVPADHGGLRMNITKQMFEELRRTCERLDLIHPAMDLVMEACQSRSREMLEQRFAERELFKRILSSNATNAREVVEWMESYRAVNKTFRTKVEEVTGKTMSNENSQLPRRLRLESEAISEYPA